MDLINYLGTWFSISIKFDFETSLQRYECDYKEISVKLCISKKKKRTYLSTHKLFFYARVHHFAKEFSCAWETAEVLILLLSTYSLRADAWLF